MEAASDTTTDTSTTSDTTATAPTTPTPPIPPNVAASNSLNTILKNCSLSPAAASLLLRCEKTVTANTTNTILRNFQEMIKIPENLDQAAEYLYESLVDDAVMGVFLEVHHLKKTGNLDALDGMTEDENSESSFRIVDKPDFDIFGMPTAKKPMDCTCPNCDRPVSAGRFAKHLAKCMGMDRKSRSSKRLATKDGASVSSSSSSSYLQLNESDEDDEVDDKRRKRNNQNARNNGSKKNNGKSF